MQKKSSAKVHAPQKKLVPQPEVDLTSKFIIGAMALVLIMLVFTPTFRTLDTNAVRFIILAFVNLLGIVAIALSNKFSLPNSTYFFNSKVGLLFALLMLLALVSFAQAIDVTESLITWFKMLTGFTTAYLIGLAIRNNPRILHPLAVFLTLFLLFDSLTVFYHIAKYISGLEESIVDIKSVYGNKNIFGASLFMKIPFALWLFTYRENWQKYLGIITTLFAFAGILFLSIRAFFLGSIGLLLIYMALATFDWVKNRNKVLLLKLLTFAGAMVLAILVYSLIQNKYYPKTNDTQFTSDVASRFSSITHGGGESRFKIWDNTFWLIKKHPMLGVGTGNWKIAVLEKENQTSPDFTYKYKVHNDFLEITSESGILAGLVFALIFVLILLSNGIQLFNSTTPIFKKELVFLPMFGLIAYFFDAFFNFPHDRPEILVFFALALGISVGVEDDKQKLSSFEKVTKIFNAKGFTVLFIALQIAGCVVLYMNFKSAQAQSIVYRLYKTSKPTQAADEVIKSFPVIPQVSVLGEPIISNKAYALIAEERYKEAIKLLWANNTSPFDSRREHYIAKCYYKMGNSDSALYWALKAYKIKPYLLANTGIITVEYQKKGQDSLAFSYIENHLAKIKNDEAAYELCAGVYYNAKQFDKSLAILDTGLKYLPQSKLVNDTKKKYFVSINTTKYKDFFERSLQNMGKGNYTLALDQITEFIAKVPNNGQAYGQRAFCHFYLKQFQKSIDDINTSFSLNNNDYNLLNLRGVNYRELGDNDKACADFKAAMDKGRADAADNYRKFCQKKP